MAKKNRLLPIYIVLIVIAVLIFINLNTEEKPEHSLFTIYGQNAQCHVYPDDSGEIPYSQRNKLIGEGYEPALVNFFWGSSYDNKYEKFCGESIAPARLTDKHGYGWGGECDYNGGGHFFYEIYRCPECTSTGSCPPGCNAQHPAGGSLGCNGVTPTPTKCIEKSHSFYTNVEAASKSYNWQWIPVGIATVIYNTENKILGAKEIDPYIPGFSSKFRENQDTACCDKLEPLFKDNKLYEFTSSSGLIPFWGKGDNVKVSYDIYTCVPEGEAWCPFPALHTFMKKYTHSDNCMSNTILAGAIFFVLVLILMTILGGIGKK